MEFFLWFFVVVLFQSCTTFIFFLLLVFPVNDERFSRMIMGVVVNCGETVFFGAGLFFTYYKTAVAKCTVNVV